MSNKSSCLLLILMLTMLGLTGCMKSTTTTQTPAATSVLAGTVNPEVTNTADLAMPTASVESPTSVTSANCHKIAFSQYDGLNYDIYSVCPDGSGLTNLTHDAADDVDPAWSPDGRRIAFASSRSGHFQIYLMDQDGGNVSALTTDYENQYPVWVDGGHLAFRTDDGKGMFWWRVIDFGDSSIITISEPSFDFFYQTPAWSPDGRKIAYMSLVEHQERNDGSSQIHVKNADGSGELALTQDIWANLNPVWSPDGTKIAFLSERGGTYDMFALYVMNADGTDVQQITSEGYPTDAIYDWSPDGSQIVISGNNLFNGINLIDLDSKEIHPLMEWSTPANVVWPSWQP